MDLNQVTLPSKDIARSIKFYRDLGFTLIVETAHYARFECPVGDATFSVHLVDREISETGVVVYFEASDLDERVSKLSHRGIRFDQQPKDEPWLWREARLKDPDGNTICLFFAAGNRKNPPWRVGA